VPRQSLPNGSQGVNVILGQSVSSLRTLSCLTSQFVLDCLAHSFRPIVHVEPNLNRDYRFLTIDEYYDPVDRRAIVPTNIGQQIPITWTEFYSGLD
jgi:hypothetical protein